MQTRKTHKINNGKKDVILMMVPPPDRYPFGLARLASALSKHDIKVKRLYPLELKTCKKLDVGSSRWSYDYITGKQPLPFIMAIIREFKEKGEITASFVEEGVYIDICESIAIPPIRFKENIVSAALEIETWVQNNDNFSSAGIVGFTLLESNVISTVLASIFIRKYYPEICIVYGGPAVTQCKYSRELFLKLSACDFCVRAEGENAFPELCRKLLEEFPGEVPSFEKVCTIPNISALLSGKIKESEVQTIENLDELPRPDLSDFRFWQEKLLKYSSARRKIRMITAPIEGSRGCLMTCEFCAERRMHGKFRRRSPMRVVDDIEEYVSRYGIWNFHFVDSLIDHTKEWLLAFAKELMKRDLRIAWGGFMTASPRPRPFNQNEVKLLKKAGLMNVTVGIEALNEETLISIGKGKRLRDTDRFETIDFFIKQGIIVNVNLILVPTQTFKDIEKFLLKVKRLQERFTIQCNSIRVLEYRPGSKLLEKLQNEHVKYLASNKKPAWMGKFIRYIKKAFKNKPKIITWGELFPELCHLESDNPLLQVPAAISNGNKQSFFQMLLKWSELLHEDFLDVSLFPNIDLLVNIVKRIFSREELKQQIFYLAGDPCFRKTETGLITPETDIYVKLGMTEGVLESREVAFLRDLATTGRKLSEVIELYKKDFTEDEIFELIYPLISTGIIVQQTEESITHNNSDRVISGVSCRVSIKPGE
ncbi:MAG: B12-binding domain-containing radical SAM protein [Candidatus Odinarchaeota archaeon]